MENSFKFIKNTFLQLTSKTYPYGYEDDLVKEMTVNGIFPNLEKDEWGNYFYKIGESRTIFASHLDTACRDQSKVKHRIDKQQIVTTDGTSILGADDKAGVTILLWLIKNNIPGLYYFFIGEEVGCVGSSSAAPLGNFRGNYDRIISFDRRGTNSVITYQSSYRCCSDDFANALAKQLNLKTNLFYKIDETGVYTDSAEFVDYIPECTNLSVGYLNEHTTRESQDLYHLNKLALASLGVEWEKLPTKRDASKRESKWDSKFSSKRDYRPNKSSRTVFDEDYEYGYVSRNYENSLAEYDERINDFFEDFDDDSIPRPVKSTRQSAARPRTTERWQELDNNGEVRRTYVDSSKSRTFFDNGNGRLTPFENKTSVGIFDVLRDKFLTSDLTKRDIEMIRDQYFDMSDPNDKRCFDELNYCL